MLIFFCVVEKYKVQFLVEVCEDILLLNILRENVIMIFDIVKKYCLSFVKEVVLMKVMKMGEILIYDEYKYYIQKDLGLLLELYEQLLEWIGFLFVKRWWILMGKVQWQFYLCVDVLELFDINGV